MSMHGTVQTRPNPWQRFIQWLPSRITRSTRVFAWLVLISNIVIVGSGGLVRLTGSGMGCETWPYCTADSLIPTPELGIHGIIEFTNRTLTGVLIVIALLAFLSVVKLKATRPELWKLTFANGIGIILQAVVGGVVVWLHLPPSLVGIHFLISGALVANGAAYVYRVYSGPGPRRSAVGRGFTLLARLTAVAVAITVVVGILLTGAGPHAGDNAAARNGRTPPVLRLRLWVGLLLSVEVLQIAVGLWQARSGLPIALVNIHMVLAVALVAAMTAVIMNLKAPAAVADLEAAPSSTPVHA